MKTILAKVNVTSVLRDWWESDMDDIFTDKNNVKIIGCVSDEGHLDIIYTYEIDDNEWEDENDT